MVNSPRIAQGVLIEKVGEELVVVIRGSNEAIRVTGETAVTLTHIQSGAQVDTRSTAIRELLELGIIEVPGFSRRGLIAAGAVGAGAGIAVLAMPGVAAASSDPLDNSDDGDNDDDDDDDKDDNAGEVQLPKKSLNGYFFAFNWATSNEVSAPGVAEELDWVAGVFLPLDDNPCEPSDATGNRATTLKGEIEVEGTIYDAYLFNDLGTDGEFYPTFYFLGSPETLTYDTPFVLTFILRGVEYTVTEPPPVI